MKRVFIVGCPRSGTTLIQTLLAAQGDLVSPPETHFFNYLVPRSYAKYLRVASRSGRDRIVRHMARIGLDFQPPPSSWTSEWSKALVECLDALARADFANGWIEKTPVHLHFVDLIESLIPDACFVHIVRNGQDTCASLYEAASSYPEAWGGKRSAIDCAKRWVHDVNISLNKQSSPHHKLITYEGLMSDSFNTLSDCLSFLNLRNVIDDKTLSVSQSAYDKAVLVDEPWKRFESTIKATHGKFFSVFSHEQQSQVSQILDRSPASIKFSLLSKP